MSLNISNESWMPGPLEDFKDVLLALSKEDLYIKFSPRELQISDIKLAVFKACSLFSITHGPAIKVNLLSLLTTKSLILISLLFLIIIFT